MRRTNAEFKKIKSIFEFAWDNPYSTFYKDKYKKAGIKSVKSLKTWDDFNRLPYLTRDEIVEAGPEKFLFFPKNKIVTVGLSSGTTKNKLPLVIFIPRFTNEYEKGHTKYKELKIKSMMQLYQPFSAQHRYKYDVDFMGKNTIITMGDINNLDVSAKIAARLKIDTLKTTPTVLYRFIPYLKKEYDLNKIKLVCLGGEFCSEQKALFFKKNFSKAYFEFTFGGAETGGKGYRCNRLSKLSPRFLHAYSKTFYYQTINSNGQSELVLTSLTRNSNLLIKYKTGDAVRLYEEKCPCKENLCMEVFGRLEYDSMKVQGSLIYSALVSKALFPFSSYLSSPDWKLHVFEENKNGKITPRLVLQLIPAKQNNNTKIKNLIQEGVSRNLFVTTKFTLSDLVKEGVFMPLEIEFLEEFPVELKPRHIISHLK